jgi:vancomycin permeability regulator SanA
MLEDRLRIALELLSAGRVERLLLSGAATPARGDEVHAMRSFCRRQGVAASRLVCDPGGTRTRLSLQRAAELFGVRRVYLCTQRFHLPRARYWAEAYGLDAVAAPADRRPYRRALRDRTRELAAWAKALAERWLLAPPSR